MEQEAMNGSNLCTTRFPFAVQELVVNNNEFGRAKRIRLHGNESNMESSKEIQDKNTCTCKSQCLRLYCEYGYRMEDKQWYDGPSLLRSRLNFGLHNLQPIWRHKMARNAMVVTTLPKNLQMKWIYMEKTSAAYKIFEYLTSNDLAYTDTCKMSDLKSLFSLIAHGCPREGGLHRHDEPLVAYISDSCRSCVFGREESQGTPIGISSCQFGAVEVVTGSRPKQTHPL